MTRSKTRTLQILVTVFTLVVLALGVTGVSASVVASPLDPSDYGESLVNALSGTGIKSPEAMLVARLALGLAVLVAIAGWTVVAVMLKRARLEISQIWKPDPREVKEYEEAHRRDDEPDDRD